MLENLLKVPLLAVMVVVDTFKPKKASFATIKESPPIMLEVVDRKPVTLTLERTFTIPLMIVEAFTFKAPPTTMEESTVIVLFTLSVEVFILLKATPPTTLRVPPISALQATTILLPTFTF